MSFTHERCPECQQLSVVFNSEPFACRNEACADDASTPLPAPPRGTSGFSVVYYLRFGDRIKIGVTTSPAERFAAIPHDEVLAWEPGDAQTERARHRDFADARVDGHREWFHCTPALLAHVSVLRAGDADPKSSAIAAAGEALLLEMGLRP
ncbi:GIY-YIG nuclease family protein [Microbacterium resistens]|uniref:GIY-YIG nuclease family protein n=1 Tax=Microbacterium resistens TaxID=156977 RepID=UPI001C593BCF|nr:GIY-YIG nuclease family protein [Microbacterium resistens]MBW1639251.1 GIY-YIG nuclease family protein [Microbacterium resistens]